MRRVALVLAGALLAGCTPQIDWAAYDRYAIAEGLHRLERSPPDAPFSEQDLIVNFQRIAFGVEAMLDQDAREVPLRRWSGPIIYAVEGDGVTSDDLSVIEGFMQELSGLSGVEVREGDSNVNFVVFILGRDTREAAADLFSQSDRRGARFLARFIGQPDAPHPCRGTITTDDTGEIGFAAVLIKDEAVGRLRRTCIEEEFSQSFGLTNDHPEVRPSLFNDDQEFALFTEHDAALMQMLYHPLLQPGMSREEAAPLLPEVTADLRQRGLVRPVDTGVPTRPTNRAGVGRAGG